MAIRKTDEEKEQIIQAYIASGLNITNFCKLESSGTTGVSTLSTWLEDKGYRMVLETTSGTTGCVITSAEYDKLLAENEKLKNKVLAMNIKYRKEELFEAMDLMESPV